MTEKSDKALLGSISSKILSWLLPFLAGLVLMTVVNSGVNQRQIEINTQDITSMKLEIKELKTTYATNKRVDDLQEEVRSNYRALTDKSDRILELLAQQQKRR